MSQLLVLMSLLLFASTHGSLLVDTDVDLDDMGALMCLLAKQEDIIGITVEGNGWSNQYAGAINVQRIMQFANCSKVEVSFGELPYTVLSNAGFNGQHAVDLPPQEYLDGIDLTLSGNCSNSSWPYRPSFFYPHGAARLIVDAVMSADAHTVDLLLLGPFTNIARAVALEPKLVRRLRTIYVSGGDFSSDLEAWSADADSKTAGFYTSKTEPHSSGGQNMFLDAIATSMVLSSVQRCQADLASGSSATRRCPEMRFMSGSAQHQLPASTSAQIDVLCPSCMSRFSARVKAYMQALSPCGGQPIDEIYYWDESAAVMASQRGDGSFCSEWTQVSAVVQLANGPFYSSLVKVPSEAAGVSVHVCTSANITKFLEDFWAPLNANEMPSCSRIDQTALTPPIPGLFANPRR